MAVGVGGGGLGVEAAGAVAVTVAVSVAMVVGVGVKVGVAVGVSVGVGLGVDVGVGVGVRVAVGVGDGVAVGVGVGVAVGGAVTVNPVERGSGELVGPDDARTVTVWPPRLTRAGTMNEPVPFPSFMSREPTWVPSKRIAAAGSVMPRNPKAVTATGVTGGPDVGATVTPADWACATGPAKSNAAQHATMSKRQAPRFT